MVGDVPPSFNAAHAQKDRTDLQQAGEATPAHVLVVVRHDGQLRVLLVRRVRRHERHRHASQNEDAKNGEARGPIVFREVRVARSAVEGDVQEGLDDAAPDERDHEARRLRIGAVELPQREESPATQDEERGTTENKSSDVAGLRREWRWRR